MLKFLKHPVVVVPSTIGLGYGLYAIYTTTQSGTSLSIANQTDKTYIVTGATDGIGRAVTQALANQNARVIMASRNRNKCQEVRRDIVLESRNKQIFCRICDMSDFNSIREFVTKLDKGKYKIDRIDGVVLNAAIQEPKRQTNNEGIELNIATNHLGPFLLTGLLMKRLLDQDHPSRIVFLNTAIAAQDKIKIDLDSLNEAKFTRKGLPDPNGKYYAGDAYRYSKALELIFSRELSDRLKESNISVITADPGWTRTKLESRITFKSWHWITGLFLRNPNKSAKTALYALVDPDAKNGTFIDRHFKEQSWGANAENDQFRKQIWLLSERWTKLSEHLDKMYFGSDDLHSIKSNAEGEKVKSEKSWKYLYLF